ncbi:hypothetical protein PENTCL1PPCAC_16156, partial [Pristionchus entomophagus]
IVCSTPKTMRSYSIFLLNDVIIDIISAIASGLTAARVMCLPDDSVIIVYVGQCNPIGGILFCNICECMQMLLVSESTAILLLSFIYRRYIIRAGAEFVSLYPTKPIWIFCLLAYLAFSPIWVSRFHTLQ